MTIRCNPSERKAFRSKRYVVGNSIIIGVEPALGTLDERLGIILRRLGGHTELPRLTPAERDQLRKATAA